ncbi:prohibitin family protein [Candidatus Uhrbacteria bacterium]|nr:prohibitin family protein [Candidatus Uhrbacteria bacterium]
MNESLDRMMYTFVVEDVLKGFFVYVPPGYVACVYDLGRGVLKKCLLPGLHLKVPFWQRAKLFNTQTLEYRLAKDFNLKNVRALGDVPLSAVTADGKPVHIEGTILLRLDVTQIPNIWQNIGEDFVDKIVRPTVRSRLRMIASRFTVQELVAGQRDTIEDHMKQELERIFRPRGIIVENVLLSEVGKAKGAKEEE